ncbi:MAG: hypothetical protein IKI29_06420 [Clostridia bacterium]|nr:hypothetical protein [Clostridia bacterium]
MTVESIGETKIRFILSHQETELLFGGYQYIDYRNQQTKHILNKLLSEQDFPLDSQQLSIEVRPCIDGCMIEMTKIGQKQIRPENHWFLFQRSDDLADACSRIVYENLPSFHTTKLYRTEDKKWALCIRGTLSELSFTVLSEYCEKYYDEQNSVLLKNSIETEVCQENVIEKIASAFDGNNQH